MKPQYIKNTEKEHRCNHHKASAIPTIMLRIMVLPRLYAYYTNLIIYQIESDKSLAEQRLIEREGKSETVQQRLKDYDAEVAAGRKVANRIFVNDDSYEELKSSFWAALKKDFS